MNVATHQGTVHAARQMKFGSRTLWAPTCRKYRIDQLLYAWRTDDPITCKRCLANAQPKGTT